MFSFIYVGILIKSALTVAVILVVLILFIFLYFFTKALQEEDFFESFKFFADAGVLFLLSKFSEPLLRLSVFSLLFFPLLSD